MTSRAHIYALLVLACALLATAHVVRADAGCPGCCCQFFRTHGTPPLLAYGCYFGDGTDDRLIHTGIPAASAGALLVNKVSTSEAFCNRWLTPDMLTATINGRGQANCTNNEVAALFDGFSADGFVINDTGAGSDSLNEDLEAYCWYEWATSPGWHGTFTYTGDGTTPRTLTLTGAGAIATKSLVFIQNRNNGDGPVLANNITAKTSDMATNQSMLWSHTSFSTSDAEMIRALGTDQVDVGSHLNESAVVYFGAWWNLTNTARGGTITWTGNGTTGGANCGTSVDVQNFGIGNCAITAMLTVEDFFDEDAGCAHQECDAVRALNISANIAGPGHISGDDFYIQQQAAPDDTDGLKLVGGSFSVSGGPATETSCNDNTQSYFAAFWCAQPPPVVDTPAPTVTRTPTSTVTQTPTITLTPSITPTATPTTSDTSPLDWSGSFIAVWEMDEADNTTRASTGTCVADCALANQGTVLKNTTSGQFAFGTGGAAADTAITDQLRCAVGTCNELNLSAIAAATWGCYGYVGIDSSAGAMLAWSTNTLRWSIGRSTVNNTVQCQGRNAASSLVAAHSANNTWNAADRVFAACTFDDANNELKAYVANTAGTPSTLSDIGNTTVGFFQAAGGDFGWTGTVDTCFLEDHELSDTDLCRLCSCGVNGALGSCLCTGGGTAYTNTGYNTTECGSCTLPDCNKAAPD